MSHWKSIVIGVDFTHCSATALKQAIRIAAWDRASLHAVHFIEPLVVADLEEALRPSGADVRAGLVRDARDAWREFTVGLPEAAGLDLEVEIGDPRVGILRRARELSADLLVLGTHGVSPPDTGAGALAAACVRKAETSVLLVADPHGRPFTSVVACTDFSPMSANALEQAVRVAAHDGAELHVLHVFDAPWHRLHYRAPTPQASPDYQRQYRDGLTRRLKAFCEPFQARMAPLRVRYEIFDYPGHGRGITEYVQRVGAELVVLGTRGRTDLRDILLGSTAERVVRDARCSILAVKPGDVEPPAGR